jgi:hypothetical protein
MGYNKKQTIIERIKIMKISEIKIETKQVRSWQSSTGFHVETKTDAYQVIDTEKRREMYIAQYGDVETVYDERFKVYRVPAFKAEIEAYTKMKAAHCARYGSN